MVTAEPLKKVLFADLGRSLLAAALAVGCVAGVEAYWVATREGASFISALLVNAGLLGPLGACVSVAVGAASLFLHGRLIAGHPLRNRARPLDAEARAWAASVLLAGPPLGALWLVSSAGLALAALTSRDAARVSGPILGIGTGLHAFFALSVAGVVVAALRARYRQHAPSLGLRAALGFGLAAIIIALGILLGETSGEGHALLLLGVLKRPELDLRPTGLLLLLALGTYLLPIGLARLPGSLAALFGAGFLSAVVSHAARSDFEMTAIERAAPLGRLALGALRRITDRDGDGFSAYFGGNDCAPTDPQHHPSALDVPGNGSDEDCSGADEVALPEVEPRAPERGPNPRVNVPKNLNVMLITVDTLRADLGFAGYPRPVSPNLDAFAARSTVFENAYALASYTPKSLGPMLIGKYSSETHRDFAHYDAFGKSDIFLQERLQKAGVRTVSIQSFWYLFAPQNGFVRGFDVVDSNAAPKTPAGEGDRTVTGDKVTERAIAQLQKLESTGGQFFFWVHYVDPHSEYVVHEGFNFGKSSRDAYDSEVAFVDREVGRLLDYTRNSPLAARTAIVLTSDHGEAFGEHGMIRHGFELWEELLRVPLVMFVPGAQPQRVAARRSAIGLVPTVLELQGVAWPSGEGSDFISGRSLLPDVYSTGSENAEAIPVFADMSAGPHNAERQAFFDGDLKLVVSSGQSVSLFDLKLDPKERNNLVRDKPLLSGVLARYKAFKRRLRPVFVRRP